MTSHEKVQALVEAFSRLDPREVAPELAQVLEGVAIVRGLGFPIPNPVEFLLPADPAETDILVDKIICLLLELRGDDLPPFDPGRYGESVIAELLGAADEVNEGE